MTYAQSFNLATPTGLEEANTIDEIIRNVKIALNERFTDILGVDLSSATDPQRVTKIVIPSAGMTIRNSTDAASLISITNSGASLASPTITGTMTATGATISGGTVAPTTLTVPNGTAITNASLTTPALVDVAIVGGTVSGLTALSVTGTPVITGNLTVTGTVTAGSLSGPTSVTAANVTAGAFQNAAYTFPNNLNVSGTLAPTTLNIPSGTTIPTHTETGTITATGSTRNGGTLSSATLNNTTFTGTVSGLSTNPTTGYNQLTTSTALTTTNTIQLSVSLSAGTWMVIASGYVQMSNPAGGFLGNTILQLNCPEASTGSFNQAYVDSGANTTAGGSVAIPFTLNSIIIHPTGNNVSLYAQKGTAGTTATMWNPRLFAIKMA